MNNNDSINIFTKKGDLKFAPYWGKIEAYISKVGFNQNINELLIDAMDAEIVRLTWVMQNIIPLKDAQEITDNIFENALIVVVNYPEISSEDLYYLIKDKSIQLLNTYVDKDGTLSKFLVGLIDIFIRNFVRLKKGSDIFCDLMFSDSIITDKLEDDNNINALFAFISALGPNIYENEYLNKNIENDEY